MSPQRASELVSDPGRHARPAQALDEPLRVQLWLGYIGQVVQVVVHRGQDPPQGAVDDVVATELDP